MKVGYQDGTVYSLVVHVPELIGKAKEIVSNGHNTWFYMILFVGEMVDFQIISLNVFPLL